MHAWPRALTAAYIMGKVPVACLAGGKVIVLGLPHKVLDGIQQKLGKAHQAISASAETLVCTLGNLPVVYSNAVACLAGAR